MGIHIFCLFFVGTGSKLFVFRVVAQKKTVSVQQRDHRGGLDGDGAKERRVAYIVPVTLTLCRWRLFTETKGLELLWLGALIVGKSVGPRLRKRFTLYVAPSFLDCRDGFSFPLHNTPVSAGKQGGWGSSPRGSRAC